MGVVLACVDLCAVLETLGDSAVSSMDVVWAGSSNGVLVVLLLC